MRLPSLLLLFFIAPAAPAQTAACRPVAADQILARDLAAAIPAFQAVPADTLLAATPPPGIRRTFHVPELQNIARRYSVILESPSEVCFEWPVAPLDRPAIIDSMRKSLANPDAHIEIAELGLNPAPQGAIEFPREHLGTPAGPEQHAPVLWRGEVVYGAGHRFPIWARVRITVPCDHIIAAEDLKPGLPLQPSQLRATTGECFPSARASLSLDQLVGLTLKRRVAPGAPILPDMVEGVKDVNRGDIVAIEVFSGSAHLQFSAKAETPGAVGETIALRNPASNRIFRARVSGKGRAVVQASPAEPLSDATRDLIQRD